MHNSEEEQMRPILESQRQQLANNSIRHKHTRVHVFLQIVEAFSNHGNYFHMRVDVVGKRVQSLDIYYKWRGHVAFSVYWVPLIMCFVNEKIVQLCENVNFVEIISMSQGEKKLICTQKKSTKKKVEHIVCGLMHALHIDTFKQVIYAYSYKTNNNHILIILNMIMTMICLNN
ncbi:hypothetical protein CR513_18495, partial [Mucuna pruriens]